jgi:signal transduction histidine kinase
VLVPAATARLPRGKLGALHAVVTMEREISLPFAQTAPPGTRQQIEHAESAVTRHRLAALLEEQADDLAARWERRAGALPTNMAASDVADPARAASGSALVRALAAAMADDQGGTDVAWTLGAAFGTSAFQAGTRAHQVLLALDLLESICLDAIEGALDGTEAPTIGVADGLRICRRLQHAAAAIAIAATRGYAEAMDHALQERFRRLRHDLRNPLGTIQSALSLMADETVPEEARRSPRFRAMIERNTATLDQMIVTRLSDAEARLVVPAPADGPASPLLRAGEPGNDLTRPRERDDRQAGSF